MNARMQNLLSKMVEAGAGLQETINQVRGIIDAQFKTIKVAAKRQEWLMANVAEPLAAVYNTKLRLKDDEAILAYVSNRGTLAFKNAKGRDNNAQACNMAFRKLVTQQTTPKNVDPMAAAKRMAKAYLKLTVAERRVFRIEAGLS